MRYTTRPLSATARLRMTGKGTEHSPFRATWTSTEALLERELRTLRARNVVLQVDCAETDIRLDGQLRASARPAPRIAVAFDTPTGPLLFCCGRYRTWQDNVRAVALGLEALRRIDRYGITRSDEQYTGFRAIPERSEGGWWVHVLASYSGWPEADVLTDPSGAYRAAILKVHPDQGGSREAFDDVQRARAESSVDNSVDNR